ncbi:MAG: carbohydrate binding family 9 domain-containing protein [Vicinamibacterales bacterium]|nr:carbohydrate binding family 9 domain-containing protein [Vicinamibacterales bacterium]
MRAIPRRALALALVLTSPLLAGATPPGVSGEAASTTVEAVALADPARVTVDGELTEDAWQAARVIEGFKQREPREGEDASFPTEVRLLVDASAVYVGVVMADPEPGRIVGHLTRRDEHSPSDWVRVFIDSFNDRRTAYEFAVNPVGVKQDRYWFNDGDNDRGWDAVWDVATRRTERGWQAEFRIPFSQLRFPRQHDGRMGFAVMREIARLNEVNTWPLVAQSRMGIVSQFGQLTNLSPGQSPKRLELVPYTVAKTTLSPDDGNPLVEPRDPDALGGLDLKYALTPGLTLTATVNPDFGQVEADPAVVNLSAFETFFPERRPFFVEGSGNFRFDIDCEDDRCTGLFYSRRIGRQPQVWPEVSDEGYTQVPQQTTILGATKLTGRVGSFSVGVLHALTQAEHAVVREPGVPDTTPAVEPLTSYTVARARREFANDSNLGVMVTATNRALSDDLESSLAGQAYTGGVDVDVRLTPSYRATAYWAGSTIHGSPASIAALQENSRHYFQRPDADHLDHDPARTSLNGHAGQAAFAKVGGERLRFRSSYSFKSPGFDVNDVGYMRLADRRSVMNWAQLRYLTPTAWYRSLRVNVNQWAGWNYGDDLVNNGLNVNAHVQFLNHWRTGFGVNWNSEVFDDRLTRGGPGGLRPERRGLWTYLEGDDRKPVVVNLFGFVGGDRYGEADVEVGPSVTFRPSSALTIEPGVSWARNRSATQWVEQVEAPDGPHYVFGAIDQKTLAFSLRVNYAIGPTLSLQLYAQPFVSAGAYGDYKELVDGRAEYFGDRYRPFAYAGNADFRYSSLRSTNVLRWEYRPGSTLFVVWQHGRESTHDTGDFSFSRDVRGIFESGVLVQPVGPPRRGAATRRRGRSGQPSRQWKSCDSTAGAAPPMGSTRSARTAVTPSCCCSTPSTTTNGSWTITVRWASNRSGRTMTLAMPVSSSSVRKQKPLAVPGRWRVITAPATRTRRPCRAPGRSAARRTPRSARSRRFSAMGCGPMVRPVPS